MERAAARSPGNYGLPRTIGDGLTVRWATAEDLELVEAFNGYIHADAPPEPNHWVMGWVRDLMSGRHPTTGASDFTVVMDERSGALVSSMCLIPQTWSYQGITFAVGRPELVGTDPAYRRRGLVRAQLEALHALSADRGELVQAITGIPWYYRQFGYEMALDLGGGRRQYWSRLIALKDGETECYCMRPATLADIPLLAQLYDRDRARGIVSLVRDAAMWRWELQDMAQTIYRPAYKIIEKQDGTPAGYVEAPWSIMSTSINVREIAAVPGVPLRDLGAFVGRALKAEAGSAQEEPRTDLWWELGGDHPVYTALQDRLETLEPPYAWYVRVEDLTGFLQRITPVLEQRLVGSIFDGYSGLLRLNFYTETLALRFEHGKLRERGPFTRERLDDGDACFPDRTFLQLLFGHRSMADLQYARPDCIARDGSAALLDTLFPRRPSNPIAFS